MQGNLEIFAEHRLVVSSSEHDLKDSALGRVRRQTDETRLAAAADADTQTVALGDTEDPVNTGHVIQREVEQNHVERRSMSFVVHR